MKVTTVGVDTAKNVFQVHGVDEQGRRVFARQIKVSEVIEFFTRLAPCVVAMEACGSSHYWARRLSALGHTVKLIAPQFVKPYVKTNKNDAADAAAICTAARQPDMRFVAPKSVEQQAVMALHGLRSGAMKARNALACRLRGLLLEFGIAIAKGIGHVRKRIPEILEDAGNGSRIDVRSKSRLGKSDLGVNAKRIRTFFAKLRAGQVIAKWKDLTPQPTGISKILGMA